MCKAQETRGSKFIYEFGRNSTVYCFVASENKTAPTRKIQNLSHFLKVYQRVEIYNFAFSTRWRRPMAAPTKLYNLLQNRRGEHCSPLILYSYADIIIFQIFFKFRYRKFIEMEKACRQNRIGFAGCKRIKKMFCLACSA